MRSSNHAGSFRLQLFRLVVGHQRVDLALRDALAFHVDLDPHVGEADRLLADVAGAPHRRDVEVALEFEFELVDDPAAVNRVGMKADGEAGAERAAVLGCPRVVR